MYISNGGVASNTAVKSWIYGGSISATGYSIRASINGHTAITIDASQNAISFGDDSHIVAGSYQFGTISGNASVIFTGISENLGLDAGNLVWGGCSADVYRTDENGVHSFQTTISGNRIIVMSSAANSLPVSAASM